MKQNRLRSWAMWLAILAALWLVLQVFGIADSIGLTSEKWEAAVNLLGVVLVGFGIVNNPTDKTSL